MFEANTFRRLFAIVFKFVIGFLFIIVISLVLLLLLLLLLLLSFFGLPWKSRRRETSHCNLFCNKVALRCSCIEISDVVDSTTSAGKKSCSVERGSALAKLSVLLKLCLLTWDTEMLWILIERTNPEHPRKIRYSGKNLSIFLDAGCSFVVFACFLGK